VVFLLKKFVTKTLLMPKQLTIAGRVLFSGIDTLIACTDKAPAESTIVSNADSSTSAKMQYGTSFESQVK